MEVQQFKSGLTSLTSKSTLDVWLACVAIEKITRSFCWSTTADWSVTAPVWSGAVNLTTCKD